MIVTCESCQAKYKLDDAKITGRGAKITCPKCKHVFVVYTAGGQPAAPASAPARVTPPPPSPFSSPPPPAVTAPDPEGESWEEDEPTRIGMASVPAPSRRPSLPPPRPDVGRRSNPTLALPDPSEHGVAFLPPPPPSNSVTVSPAFLGDSATRAASLDFKKVGVATWKVKVKIGLIYDFSDIKTLRKYIQDQRVTPSDAISYDGRAWKTLGEIPDLDVFFVETWERLNRQRAEQAPPAALEMPPPSRPVGMTTGPVEAPRRAEETPRPSPEPNQFRDPFEELKSKQRERVAGKRATAPTPTPAGNGPLIAVGVVALIALLGGGGWYFWTRPDDAVVADRPAATSPKTTTPAAPADIREQIQNQLKEGMQKVPDGEPVVAPAPDPHELTPVRPSNVPAGATPVKVGPDPRPTATPTTGKSGQLINTSDATATDHEAIGDASARAGDWAGAVKAYGNAVGLDPKNGRLLKKLGEAQSKAGDKDAAAETLKRAAAEGQRDAYKLLGNIAREQGDTSNAVYQYQLYLAGHPKDSAEIEKLIQEMSGGG